MGIEKGLTKRRGLSILIGVILFAALTLAVWGAFAPATVIGSAIAQGETLSSPVDALIESEAIPVKEDALSEASEETLEGEAAVYYEAAVLICNFLEDLLNLDLYNTDPLIVSAAHYFSGYGGQFVFFGNWNNRRSGSFGRVMGVHVRDQASPLSYLSELLKHEHGHYEQYLRIGLLKYIFAIAVPSILHDPDDYYSQPWEVTADLLGGVTTHYHAPGSEAAGWNYLNRIENTALFTVIKNALS